MFLDDVEPDLPEVVEEPLDLVVDFDLEEVSVEVLLDPEDLESVDLELSECVLVVVCLSVWEDVPELLVDFLSVLCVS